MPVPQAAKTVAFSTSREDEVLSYRFACMFVSFRSKLKKLWHNRRSFPRGAWPPAVPAAMERSRSIRI
jgi:hypothetical protein